tara:strand:+ start:988 stop:1254 length:267 start_codon:yes stop_codon:yes gene_type:complete
MRDKTASFRTETGKLDRLDRLAQNIDRSRSWLINDALDRYLDYEEWVLQSVDAGMASLDAGKAVAHDDVMAEARALVLKAQQRKNNAE